MTYSIVAYSKSEGLLGVGVVSGSIAVGSRVPWARYPYGAVATQAYTNPALGPLILKYLANGLDPKKALEKALSEDPEPSMRQVAVIDSKLNKAVHNGMNIPQPSGSFESKHAVCIANLVVDPDLAFELCRAFEDEFRRKGLVESILLALMHAEDLGGDARGDKSAAILVVGSTRYGELYDRVLDLRVDYDPWRKPAYKLYDLYRMVYRSY